MMRRALLLLTVLLGLLSTAHARFYISLPGSAIITGVGVLPTGGLGVGTYELFGRLGVRASAQTSLLNPGGFVEGSVDGIYSFGEGVVIYGGAGLGYSNYLGGNATVAGFAGLDLDASSVISLFLELRPTLYIGFGSAIQIRSGVNFHFGSSGGDSVQGECCIIP